MNCNIKKYYDNTTAINFNTTSIQLLKQLIILSPAIIDVKQSGNSKGYGGKDLKLHPNDCVMPANTENRMRVA